MIGMVLGIAASLLAAGALALWFRRMNAVALAGRRALPFALCAAAIASAIAALQSEPGWIGGAFAAMGLAIGTAWIALGLFARQSLQAPTIAIGSALPAIVALDETDAPFDVASLRGHPVLIKLFRGHW